MGQRPPHLRPPAHLSPNTPVPEPEAVTMPPEPNPDRPDPVRYGDWELKGIAIDF